MPMSEVELLRLYSLRLSDMILVLGNGGVKISQRYGYDALLNGYVMTLQRFSCFAMA